MIKLSKQNEHGIQFIVNVNEETQTKDVIGVVGEIKNLYEQKVILEMPKTIHSHCVMLMDGEATEFDTLADAKTYAKSLYSVRV